MKPLFLCSVSLAALVADVSRPAHAADAPKLSPKELEFFETKIRPVLVENCYKCHSAGAEKIKGGLVLDTREGALKGGDTGPVLVPGNPEKSLMIQAVRYQDKDLQMPPNDKKLPASVIADLEQWIRMGAPDPRTQGATAAQNYAVEMEKARQHWAYRPIAKPPVPRGTSPQHRAENAIDSFILEKLLAKGLTPSLRADKVTLVRRATFDLHGLPPTQQEVDAFVADTSASAWEKLIDRLLASPRYGERWGRHWLDLAKYADTKGPQNQGRDNRYLWSHTYRDWVIRAFNEDLPYDEFLVQQIASDKLNLYDTRAQAAMGFLTLGNRFNNNPNDVIDDRIDTLGKATMGLTLACARCHDHKFDPVPTKDYYSLHGVFNSSAEPKEGPLLEELKETPAYRSFLAALAVKEAALAKFTEEVSRQVAASLRTNIADYWLALHAHKKETNGLPRTTFVQRLGLNPNTANAWNDYLKNRAAKKHDPVFAPWLALAALPDKEFTARARELSAKFYANADKAKPLNPAVARLFVTPPASLAQTAARYEGLFLTVDKAWQSRLASHEAQVKLASTPPPEPKSLPDPAQEELRQVLYAKNSPAFVDERVVQNFVNRDNNVRNRYNTLQREVNDVKILHAGSPARAHVLQDAEKPKDSYVMVKGNPGNRGPVVPRQAPAILTGDNRQPFKDGSGRLELARVIASRDNPLTARVLANRVWLHHFGEGLVRTPDDFGLRSEPPSHPELLDYLAAWFMENGWSLKKLHRLLMLSATYQQGSDENARLAQIDPDNRYYWQMNRRRLDFEGLRDALLHIGGRLDFAMGGPGVRLNAEPYPTRRSVYGYVDRNAVPSMLQSFDFANPDLTTGRRDTTIVPQQALFMMNSPLVVEQARNLTQRPDFKGAVRPEDKVRLLYKLIYQREPTDLERQLAFDYLRGEATTTAANAGALAWEYGYGEYDAVEKRMKTYVQMGNFDGSAWMPASRQGGRLGPVALTAKGGIPGNGLQHGAVRRWTARRDGFIAIDGALEHQGKTADGGVRGFIVSSGTGLLGTYTAQKSQTPVKLPRVLIRRGDTIDFVVIGKGQFNWAPQIKLLDGTPKSGPGEAVEWNAEKDFSGNVAPKHLEPWEKLAQVLLQTNELIFIN